jgi:hypothetical protein
LLEKGVQEHGTSWAKIAPSIEGRNTEQCRDEWKVHPANKVRTACILKISYTSTNESINLSKNKKNRSKAAKDAWKRAANALADLKASAAPNLYEDSSSSGAFIL